MTVQSYTGVINTNGEWVSVATATELTLTSGKTYNMQIQNTGYLKVGDAEFCFSCEKFDYKATSDTLYIKTMGSPCTLTILEVE